MSCHFLSLNFLPPKANNKRIKERDSFVAVLWHERREPFQGYWIPVNPRKGNTKWKQRQAARYQSRTKPQEWEQENLILHRKQEKTEESNTERSVFSSNSLWGKGKTRPTRKAVVATEDVLTAKTIYSHFLCRRLALSPGPWLRKRNPYFICPLILLTQNYCQMSCFEHILTFRLNVK